MRIDQLIIFTGFSLMILQMTGFMIFLKINRRNMGGVPPVHPGLFKTAKVIVFLCWASLWIQAAGWTNLSLWQRPNLLSALACLCFIAGFALQLTAYFELGKNLMFGLPQKKDIDKSVLKTSGIYRFSRNPMYGGFFLMLLASCFYVLNPAVWVFALFAGWGHHKIVLTEEKFLEQQFGNKWLSYKRKARRYF